LPSFSHHGFIVGSLKDYFTKESGRN